jgi:hypothetical protein
MTAREQHKVTHDRLVASLLLADTRSERHGVYAGAEAAAGEAFRVDDADRQREEAAVSELGDQARRLHTEALRMPTREPTERVARWPGR